MNSLCLCQYTHKILPQFDGPKERKAKECYSHYTEIIADFLCFVFFVFFVTLEWHVFYNFFCLQLHPCVRPTDAKKRLCNLNFAAQIIGSKFIIDQKLRHFKVLLAVS